MRRLVLLSILAFASSHSSCKAQLDRLFTLNDTLSLQMLDAWGKIPAGMLYGNSMSLGSYSQCSKLAPEARYCLLSTKNKPIGVTIEYGGIALVNSTNHRDPLVAMGVCVPSACTEENLIEVFKQLQVQKSHFGLTLDLESASIHCQGELPITTTTIVSAGIFILIVLVGIVCSCILEFRKAFTNSTYTDGYALLETPSSTIPNRGWLIPLSALDNLKSLFSDRRVGNGGEDLRCLDGIRVLSILWVILGHIFFWMLEIPFSNTADTLQAYQNLSFLLISNAFFSVDTFFVLSGFLCAYIMLKELSTSRSFSVGHILGAYIHRYIRITPTYMIILLYYGTLARYAGSGPLWDLATGSKHNSCAQDWWKNALYIDDLYTNSKCVGWGWYLSNNFQFFLITPWLLVLYKRRPNIAHLVWMFILISSILLCAWLSATHDLKAFWINQVVNAAKRGIPVPKEQLTAISRYIYYKPWARIQPYIVGVYTAVIQHNGMAKKYFNSRFRSSIGFMFAFVLMGVVVFGVHGEQIGYPLSDTANVLYISLSRLAWGMCIAYIMSACINSKGWLINAFLSHRFWAPTARIGLLAYLIHPIIVELRYFSLKVPLYYSNLETAYMFLGTTCLTYACAVIVTVFVESPLRKLEKLFTEEYFSSKT